MGRQHDGANAWEAARAASPCRSTG